MKVLDMFDDSNSRWDRNLSERDAEKSDSEIKKSENPVASDNDSGAQDQYFDPELQRAISYAQSHYPSYKDPQIAFDKWVQRSISHSEERDLEHDEEIENLYRKLDQVATDLNKLKQQGVAEGGILKSIKRGLQGWGTGDAPTPKELVRRNKGYSDDAIKALARDTRNINPHTPGGLQKRVVDREMKKRGLGEQGVAEGADNSVEALIQVYNNRDQKIIKTKVFASEEEANRWADRNNAVILKLKDVAKKPALDETSSGSVATVVNPTPKNRAKVGTLFGGTYKQTKAKK